MESIYNLVPREQEVAEKKPMYRSSSSAKASVPCSTFGKRWSVSQVLDNILTLILHVSVGCHGTTRLYGAGQIVKKDGALFGPPKEDYGLTRTKKPTTQTLNGSGEFKYDGARRPAVPPKDDRPIMGITTTKNFVTANAVEAILQGAVENSRSVTR